MDENPLDSPKRENPDLLEQNGVSEGIEALPGRLNRYVKAKKGAIDVAEYMSSLPDHQVMGDKVKHCGDYLVFRHYFTVDQVKLHAAYLCRKHLLCPLCAIRRGSKALAAYLDRWEVIKSSNERLKPFLVTLTVKDGEHLDERFRHLHASQRELWKRKQRGRGSVLDGVVGAVWSYEVKRGSGSGSWHPHLHMIALAENIPDQIELAAEWHNITGDSFIVDVRPISESDPASGFIEVFKYAVKFSDQPPADTVHAWSTLSGKRLLASSGCFRGVQVHESLLDDPEGLEGLPYVQLFYKFLPSGYSMFRRQSGVQESKSTRKERPARVLSDELLGVLETCRRVTSERVVALTGERERLERRRAEILGKKEGV